MKLKMQNKKIFSCLLLLSFLIILSGCKKEFSFYDNLFVLDTVMSIHIRNDSAYNSDKLVSTILSEIKRLDRIFNVHNSVSEAYRLNQNAFRQEVPVSAELLECIRLALYYSELSQGAFDPTLLPFKKIWNFSGNSLKAVPNEADIQSALKNIGYQNVRVTGNRVRFLKKELALDLGGIAKGYIIDKVVALLKTAGVRNALINIGGDVFALGNKIKEKWRIGIQHPRDNDKLVSLLATQDAAVVTSGDYERFAIINGKRYHHIIHPSTGYPADGCISVSVIAEKAVIADALSTTFFVMGVKKSFELVKKIPHVEFQIIDIRNGELKIWQTPGFKRHLIPVNPS
jgi:thiamine biosynthesis lipoprotein